MKLHSLAGIYQASSGRTFGRGTFHVKVDWHWPVSTLLRVHPDGLLTGLDDMR